MGDGAVGVLAAASIGWVVAFGAAVGVGEAQAASMAPSATPPAPRSSTRRLKTVAKRDPPATVPSAPRLGAQSVGLQVGRGLALKSGLTIRAGITHSTGLRCCLIPRY